MNVHRPARFIFLVACHATFLLSLPINGAAADKKEDPPGPKLNVLSFLLPKAFQANPSLEMTAFTEMTSYGRTLPEVSPAQPTYYVAHCAGFQPMGAPVAGEHPTIPAELEHYLSQALEARGFRAAVEGGDSPRLALIYFWGSHNTIDADLAERFPDLLRRNLLERASLVGGRKLVREVAMQLDFGAGPRQLQAQHQALLVQTSRDVYYVTVSAYAYDDLAHDVRRLAWRTTMTVTSNGLAMRTAMGPLVETAGEYLGRSISDPVLLRRRVREGTVTLGELETIETIEPEPPSPAQ